MKTRIARIALATVAACSRGAVPTQTSLPAPPPSVRTVRARPGDGLTILEARATVLPSPDGEAGVAAPFRARVARIHVRPGERVRRGQPLADVVMPQLVQAAGSYAAATMRLEAYARRKAELDSLRGEGLARLADYLAADIRLSEAQAEQQSSLATLRVAELEAADVPRLLLGAGEVTLRSPIDGTVTAVRAAPGETRDPGGDPMIQVAGEGEPRIEARFARTWPEEGARYELVTPDGRRLEVTLVARVPVLDPRHGAVAAWFEPPAGTRLPDGLAGRVEVSLPARGAPASSDS